MTFKEQMDLIIKKKVIKTFDKISYGKDAAEIAAFGAEQVRKRTALGKGVATNLGAEGAFVDLSAKYIKQKKKDGYSGSKKARLTRTGQMLNAIIGIVKGKGKFFIEFIESRNDGKTNSEIASYHDKKGAGKSKVKRPFFRFSAKDYNKVANFVRKKVRAIIKNG